MKKFFLIIAVATLVISCDRNNPVDATCDDFPEPPILGFNETYYEHNYHDPCYNPLNEAEFVYVYFNGNTYKYELRIHNLQTGENRKLHESTSSIYSPIWTVSGWIYFNQSLKIYRIKSQGDSANLIYSTDSRLLTYDAYSDILFYSHIYNVITPLNQRFITIADASQFDVLEEYNLLELDTISIFYSKDWNNKIVLGSRLNYKTKTFGIYRLDLNTKQYENICYLNYENYINNYAGEIISYNNIFNDRILFTQKNGLFYFDLKNCKEFKIKNSCETVYYVNASISPDGKTILTDRIEWILRDGFTIQERHRIVQLNIDGSGEKIILD